MTAFDDALLRDAVNKRDWFVENSPRLWRAGERPVGIDVACEVICLIHNRYDEIRGERDAAYVRGQLQQAMHLLKEHERVVTKSEECVES